MSSLPAYPDFRESLLKNGFQPDESYGDPVSGFKEVDCGAHICSAHWKRKDGSAIVFTLWIRDPKVLRVAPETRGW